MLCYAMTEFSMIRLDLTIDLYIKLKGVKFLLCSLGRHLFRKLPQIGALINWLGFISISLLILILLCCPPNIDNHHTNSNPTQYNL
ncbi:hypothetical protein VNO78_34805 [Psophocarpus tetragonolobus]|uniref:Uncharacterized protein n=1 Tax=Psophocarpus tetragonolobus TaxID=3891 RepID=A0AAN9RLR3_PSOTE